MPNIGKQFVRARSLSRVKPAFSWLSKEEILHAG
jgi:hypothetical protein